MNPLGEDEKRGGRARWIAAALVLLAVLLRVVYVLEQRSGPFFDAPVMDALYHVQWAQALADGREFQPGPLFRAPLYPWFLGTVFRLFGESYLLPRLLQCLCGGATTALAYLVGRRAFGTRAALVAAFLVAVNWVLIYFDGELLIPTLAIPLNLLAVWVSLDLGEEPNPRRTGLAGMAWGLAALARPNVLLFMPFLFGWLVWRQRPRWRRGLFLGVTLAAGVLTPILPVTLYNGIVGRDLVLISSQAGVNLWIGNNPQSDGSAAIVPGTRPGWWDGYHDSIRLAEEAEGRELKASEVSSHYSGRAWDFLLGDPQRSLPHLWWKFRLFWSDWELGNNQEVRFFARRYSLLARILPPSFGLLAPLGLVGLFACRRSWKRLFPLWGFLLVYCASVILFFVCSRYRAPVLPLLAVFSGQLLVVGFDAFKSRRWRAWWAGTLGVALLAVLVQLVPERVDRTDAKGLFQLGVSELGAGRPEAAIEPLRASVEANPRFWMSRQYLGLALRGTNQLAEARSVYRGALRLAPGELGLTSYYVEACVSSGDLVEAERAARESLARNSAFPAPYDDLALIFATRGDWDAARQVLREGLTRAPDDFACNLRLGLIELQVGDPCDAIDPLARAAASPAAPGEQLREQARQAWLRAREACR